MNPLVTIVTPAYNRAAAAGTSASWHGTYPHVEPSSSTTAPRTKRRRSSAIISRGACGSGTTWAGGRSTALGHGELIATVSDDPVFPDFVARAVDFMEATPMSLSAIDWVMIDKTAGAEAIRRRVRPGEHGAVALLHARPAPSCGGRWSWRITEPRLRYVGDYEFGCVGQHADSRIRYAGVGWPQRTTTNLLQGRRWRPTRA